MAGVRDANDVQADEHVQPVRKEMDKENKQYRSDNTNTGLRKKGPAGKILQFLLSMFLLAAILFAGLLEYLTLTE